MRTNDKTLGAQAFDKARSIVKAMARDRKQIPISNATSKGTYAGLELSSPAVRVGADDFLALPSRFGDLLKYRNGSQKTLA
jgi:hypothetical protein